MGKLFILGNGFDLTLGLKSSYNDFYMRYIKKQSNQNFWELLFGECDKKWLDIEKSIEQVLLDISDNQALDLSIDDILTKTKKINNLIKFNDFDDSINNLNFEKFLTMFNLCNNRKLINYLNKYLNKRYTLATVLDIELRNFENHLKEYLNSELEEYNDKGKKLLSPITYKKNAMKLLDKISNGMNFRDINILSFNYTNFNENIFNIHGNLTDNIVIGTDLRIVNQSKQLISFTKPFKIINGRYSSSDYAALKNNEDISEIIFFGHSLGDTDFNYFKSIFDSVELYDSNVILTFYIAIYYQDDEIGIISDYESNILDLLNKYSEMSIVIKDGDVSLFTKLLLEGRLRIEVLNYDSYCNFNINYQLEKQDQLEKEKKLRKRQIEERRKRQIEERRKRQIEEKDSTSNKINIKIDKTDEFANIMKFIQECSKDINSEND